MYAFGAKKGATHGSLSPASAMQPEVSGAGEPKTDTCNGLFQHGLSSLYLSYAGGKGRFAATRWTGMGVSGGVAHLKYADDYLTRARCRHAGDTSNKTSSTTEVDFPGVALFEPE